MASFEIKDQDDQMEPLLSPPRSIIPPQKTPGEWQFNLSQSDAIKVA